MGIKYPRVLLIEIRQQKLRGENPDNWRKQTGGERKKKIGIQTVLLFRFFFNIITI